LLESCIIFYFLLKKIRISSDKIGRNGSASTHNNVLVRRMKNRVMAIVLVGICAVTQMAQARPEPMSPAPGAKAGNPDLLGPLAADQWKTPVATVNPEVLIPDDSTNARTAAVFDSHFKTPFGANAFPSANSSRSGHSQLDAAKPIEIEKVEVHSDDALSDKPVAAAPIPQSESKRVAIIAVAGMALLAFRKLRRAKTAMPPKPSFL
jgi:hypothetical protein